ncbi:hypothetical protein [Neptunicella marina]|uniref:Porin n=1 Tax=Neptunicella marina TaxID=2125989 RepID=A0A8J6IUD4_9ALTE|nr:hypothetical protein [Neptunicella marina]MBC3766082.1 hypothetical protein [Neptunicella marina]
MIKRLTSFLTLALFCNTAFSRSIELDGIVEVGYVDAAYDKNWLNSWMEGGVGVLRFNENDTLELSQALIEARGDLIDDLSYEVVAQYYPDGDQHVGISQAFLTYAPLSRGLKHQLKLGLFYPAMSLENVDTGWTSPYTYSFSAINSWLAEEVRVAGLEWSVTRSGRQYHSPHSFTFSAALFKGNDPAGTLLAWRGWALHNRQTSLNERVYFADYFQFGMFDKAFPDHLQVTRETDGRFGYYAGINWRYLQQTDVRLYYYNNSADPLAVESNWQYAWQNHFLSLAVQHKFNRNFRILAQWMDGQTGMGTYDGGVYTDFTSWYLMASYQWDKHRFSARFDDFEVVETDANPADPNDSHGHSITLAWRYQYSPQWNLGAEWLHVNSDNENRTLWRNWQAAHRQQQVMLMAQFRF